MATLKQTGKLAPYNKPWQLIRDAIHDLKLQEKCKSAIIDMGTWHTPFSGPCNQCLAGCVMSRRLGVDSTSIAFPSDFPLAVNKKLRALDYFRKGSVFLAFSTLGLSIEKLWVGRHSVAPYECDPAQFKRDMLEMADWLEELHDGKPVPKAL